MKRSLKKIVVLAMAGVMTIAPVMTASAETVAVGGAYQLTYPVWEANAALHQVVVLADFPENQSDRSYWSGEIARNLTSEAREGYEIKGVYFHCPDTEIVPNHWLADADNSSNWTITQFYSEEGLNIDAFTKAYTFTIEMNGQGFSDCALYFYYADGSGANGYNRTLYVAMRLPVGYSGNAWYKLLGYDEQGNNTGDSLDYYFSGNGGAAQATTSSVPTWKQDAKGWWVERPDGSYLVNEWFQSPSSGLWYYMGADGYMLTNTTTPDGYTVDADGIWVQ